MADDWKYDPDDFDDPGGSDASGPAGGGELVEADEAGESTDPDPDSDMSGVFGAGEGRGAVEPGSPSVENALFVLLGVGLALFVVASLLSLTPG
jgi:hypothetical protein